LAQAPIHRATAIRIERPDGVYHLNKIGGLWHLAGDTHGLCDRVRLQQAVDALTQAQIMAFVDDGPPEGAPEDALSDYGLAPQNPAASIIFETPIDEGGGTVIKPCVLRLGRPANVAATAYLATWSPLGETSRAVIALPADTVWPWLAPIDAFRLQRFVPDAQEDLSSVVVDQKPYRQNAEGWQTDDNTPLSPAQSSALQTLFDLLATDFRPTPSAHPANTQTTQITFTPLTRPDPVTITIQHDGSNDANNVWAQRNDEPVQLKLPPEGWAAIRLLGELP